MIDSNKEIGLLAGRVQKKREFQIDRKKKRICRHERERCATRAPEGN